MQHQQKDPQAKLCSVRGGTRTYAPVISILFLSNGFILGPLQLNHPGSVEVVIPIGQQGDPVQEASL